MEGVESQRDERHALADAIDKRRHDIVERWARAVRAELSDRELEPTALVDGIEDYLENIADLLRSDESTLEDGGTQVWAQVAEEHAVTRVRQGFDVDQLVHEFVLLRKVLVDIVEEEHALTDWRQSDRIVDFIEAAVEAAVASYVQHRDYLAKRTEAEHIGFVTHELRNPLSTATLTVEQLRSVQPPASPTQEQLYHLLKRSLVRLRALIDKVLLVERLDVGEVDYRPVQTTIGEILEPVLPAIVATAETKGVAFDRRFDAESVVHVDPVLTASAIQNLLDNAVNYTDAGRIALAVEQRADEIAVHVRDTCGGIPEQQLARIFEPFHRGSTRRPGSGLGLAIARRAVERQGGAIHAESSAKEGGCHFWLELPSRRH